MISKSRLISFTYCHSSWVGLMPVGTGNNSDENYRCELDEKRTEMDVSEEWHCQCRSYSTVSTAAMDSPSQELCVAQVPGTRTWPSKLRALSHAPNASTVCNLHCNTHEHNNTPTSRLPSCLPGPAQDLLLISHCR